MVGDQIGVAIMWRKPRKSRLRLVRYPLAPKKTQMHKVVKLQSDQNVLYLKKIIIRIVSITLIHQLEKSLILGIT